MIIAPLSWNLLDGLTPTGTGDAFQVGAGPERLTTVDPYERTILRERMEIVAGVNDRVDFAEDGGGPLVATVAPGVYYGGAGAAAISSAMTTAGTRRHDVSRLASGLWSVSTTSGTIDLHMATGPNIAINVLRLECGFSHYDDRTGAGSYLSDFAATGPTVLTYDLGAAKGALVSFVTRLRGSTGTTIEVRLGPTSPPSARSMVYGDAYDGETMGLAYDRPGADRHVQFVIDDSRRPTSERTAIGYLYHGPAFDTFDHITDANALEVEVSGYGKQLTQRSAIHEAKTGDIHIGEVAPGDAIRMEFSGDPGLAPGTVGAIQNLIYELGVSGYAYVMGNPACEPNRETWLVRVAQLPNIDRINRESPEGRWRLPFAFDAMGVR